MSKLLHITAGYYFRVDNEGCEAQYTMPPTFSHFRLASIQAAVAIDACAISPARLNARRDIQDALTR